MVLWRVVMLALVVQFAIVSIVVHFLYNTPPTKAPFLRSLNRTCLFTTTIPMYYINLDRSPNRRKFMENVFSCSGNLTRVTAFDSLTDKLEDSIGFGGLDRHKMTVEEYVTAAQAKRGELALTISHSKAVKEAYDDGVEAAIVLEDDASPVLAPYWQTSLDELRAQADAQFPEWELIRLQWRPVSRGDVEKFRKSAGRQQLIQVKSYGTVGMMFSRRGLSKFVGKFFDEYGKFDCLRGKVRCISDYVIPSSLETYIVSPPMIVVRLFEDSAGVRGTAGKANESYKSHVQSVAHAAQVSLEGWELRSSAGPDLNVSDFPMVYWFDDSK